MEKIPSTVKKVTLPKITVWWLDSCGPEDHWHSLEEVQTYSPVKARSAGWLVKEDDLCVVIAGTVVENGQVCGVVCIPKCSILRRQGGAKAG